MGGAEEWMVPQSLATNSPGEYSIIFEANETSRQCVDHLVTNVTILGFSGYRCLDELANNYNKLAPGYEEFPWYIIIIALVVIAIIIGLGVYFWHKEQQKAAKAAEVLQE